MVAGMVQGGAGKQSRAGQQSKAARKGAEEGRTVRRGKGRAASKAVSSKAGHQGAGQQKCSNPCKFQKWTQDFAVTFRKKNDTSVDPKQQYILKLRNLHG